MKRTEVNVLIPRRISVKGEEIMFSTNVLYIVKFVLIVNEYKWSISLSYIPSCMFNNIYL